jgi:hypothetical protein
MLLFPAIPWGIWSLSYRSWKYGNTAIPPACEGNLEETKAVA